MKSCVELIEDGYEFVGLKKFYAHDVKKNKVYHFKYNPELPIGGGRAYSQTLLNRIKYSVFDVRRDRLLDDLGWGKAKTSKHIIADLPILAVKGDWSVLNPIEKMIGHPNVELLETYEQPERILQELFS